MTKMRALVLEKQHELKLRDIDLPTEVGPGEVKIKLHTVGVCGSDVHYWGTRRPARWWKSGQG